MSELVTELSEIAPTPSTADVAALLAERQGLIRANRFLADRVEALMNVHHAAILIIEPETGTILDANDAAVRRYAHGRAELLTRHISEINTLSKAEIAERIRQAVAARRHHFEFSHRLRDGSVQEVDVYSGPILYNGSVALISFIHDATRRKSLERKLKAMASTDSLTGCCNRRRFLTILHHEFIRARRSRTPLTFAMLDLDHFKAVNDTFGHPAGDSVLKALAKNCTKLIRDSDCFGRLGGEEFGVILPATAIQAAIPVLTRIRESAQALHLVLPQGSVGATLSIGVSGVEEADPNESAMLKRADAALYAAKANGRNRLEIA